MQNFLSAATGIVVVIALIRGFARHSATTIGNVWVDLTRVDPVCAAAAVRALRDLPRRPGRRAEPRPYNDVTTLEVTHYQNPRSTPPASRSRTRKARRVTDPAQTPTQTLPMGPVASQEAIKMLGTNGGGFFNANSAHPYENPTPLANFVQMLSIFLIPAALCFAFGRMVGDPRQGWAVLRGDGPAVRRLGGVGDAWSEQHGNPLLTPLGVDQAASALQSGGNMEGKEAALRHRRLGAVRGHHHRRLLRRRRTPCTTR